jgi:hypothetical protein
VLAQLNAMIDVAPESVAPAEPARAQMGAAILVITVPVAPAFPARAQTEVVILPHVNATALAAAQHAEPYVERYECSRCHDRLPLTAFGAHQNGRRHVRCLACNVSGIKISPIL